MAAFLKTSFGDGRVVKMPPVMGGEDFGRFGREDKSIKSLIVWAGGVPQAEYDAAKKEGRTLPSLHSHFWAPDAPAVISHATEALTARTLKPLGEGKEEGAAGFGREDDTRLHDSQTSEQIDRGK